HVNHVRLQSLRTPDLRDADGLELLGGPFERAAHTAEVRRIATRHGRYDIPNVGLFVWRLGSYPLGLDDVDDGTTPTTRATARQPPRSGSRRRPPRAIRGPRAVRRCRARSTPRSTRDSGGSRSPRV